MATSTSAECRAHAEEKLAQPEREPRSRKRLIAAAEGWLFLAGQMTRLEKATGGRARNGRKSGRIRPADFHAGDLVQTLASDLRARLLYYRGVSTPLIPTLSPRGGPKRGKGAHRMRRPVTCCPSIGTGAGEPRRPSTDDFAAITARCSPRPIIAYFGMMRALCLIRVTRVY